MGCLGLEIAGAAGNQNQRVTIGGQPACQCAADAGGRTEDQSRHSPSRLDSSERKMRFGSHWWIMDLKRSHSG